jgi:type I restriction enzyme S subunit
VTLDVRADLLTAPAFDGAVRGWRRYPEYKNLGIAWLSQMPEHWGCRSLKRFSSVRYGLGQPPPEAAQGVPLLRATNVKRGRLVRDGLIFVDPADVPNSRDAWLTPGEIIVVRSGAYTGDSALVTADFAGAVAGYDLVVKVTSGSPRYVAWQMLSAELLVSQLLPKAARAAQPHLNAEELGATLFAQPTLQEQEAIAVFLDRETAKIDDLVEKSRRSAGCSG